MGCGALPVVGGRVVSPYGQRKRGMHYGVDIAAREGEPVYAVRDGRVRVVAPNGQLELYGNTVVLDHGDYLSLSAHLASVSVSPGEHVRAGQRIGTVGRTAGTRAIPDGVFGIDRAHLHLEFLARWPVHGGGGGRLDVAPVFAELGIIAPELGPLMSTCGESPTRTAGSGVGGLLLAAAALWGLARLRKG